MHRHGGWTLCTLLRELTLGVLTKGSTGWPYAKAVFLRVSIRAILSTWSSGAGKLMHELLESTPPAGGANRVMQDMLNANSLP